MIGTTPTHIFRLKIDTSLVKVAQVTYEQWGKIVLQKKTKDCEMEGNKISVSLSQEDTFLFEASEVKYQLRVKTTSGKTLKTKVFTMSLEECLDREVL